jgi:CHAT domain-containing protein
MIARRWQRIQTNPRGCVLPFHLGGCKNVVASLWKVDDDATAALMAVFYHELWVKGAPPLQALRRAQLALEQARSPASGR